MKPTEYGYRQWRKYAKQYLESHGGYCRQFIKSQWDLYWAGVRDVRLHDMSIWLIDKYGYRHHS